MQVTEVVPDFADAFPFSTFNDMQREAAPVLLETEHNVVASAPTASGKTALAELAICKTLREDGTALFVAPMRALTNEKESEWDRFEELGFSVYVVTGERDLDPGRAKRADVLVMTPEKLDSATRNHEASRYAFVRNVSCCVVDEVHLLDADRRGSVLEVTIARLRRLCDPRFVALSATMSNVDDVAEWLDAPDEATFDFDESYRPVDLNSGVRTYQRGENAFADKYRRLYRAMDLAEPHLNEDGQALVFVSSRRDTVEAAKKARDVIGERDIPIGARGDYDFHTDAEELENDDLRASVVDGVAFHHAGLSKADKDRVEEWFKQGKIDLLFSTSTLAWGVNLPARCVVIRDTKYHDPLEGEVDMSPLDVLQMLGRAGRPDYDDVGYGWVVCPPEEADRYRSLLEEGTPIESRLAERLDGHLNAEIATGTIESVEGVQQWLETTFYAVRARNDPAKYDFETLQTRVRETVESLVDRGFVETAADGAIAPTALGNLTSRYYLDLSTAERFHRLVTGGGDDCEAGATGDQSGASDLTTGDVLWAVAGAAEFDSVASRSDEADAVDAVLSNDSSAGDAASATATDALTDGQRKVLAILHTGIDGHTPDALRGDAWAIRRNADRLLAALRAFCDRFADPETANLVSRVAARLEDDVPASAVGLLAIDGVGATRARRLAETGIESPAAVREAGVDTLEGIGLSPGVAEGVLEKAEELPAIEVVWDLPESIAAGDRDISEVTVRNVGGGARAGVSLSVNGRPMTDDETYLGECTLPVACFGADTDELELAVRIVFPELPLRPIEARETVRVTN